MRRGDWVRGGLPGPAGGGAADGGALDEPWKALADQLGLTVTAKGVEHEEQRRLLESFGCHELQGFALAAPMPPEDVDRFCASRSRPRLALDEDAASPLMSDPKFNAAGIPRPAV